MSTIAGLGSDLRPRTEAGPLPFHELTESQQRTAMQVLGLLAGMTQTQSSSVHLPQDMIRIDPLRHNRTVLIDGARGSGKTTLLISMLDALQRRFGCQVDARYPQPEPHDKPNDKPQEWPDLLDKIVATRVIVPVALVDLAPLPKRSSLLLLLISSLELIVSRIEQVLSGGAGDHRASLAPFCHDAERLLLCRERWNELAAAVVHGWDEQAERRSPPSDQESYAREQMTAEQQRLDLSNLIDRFLAALQADFRTYLKHVATHRPRSGQEPLVMFLIAVDDADMNPGRVAELLETLRLLGHRQLSFLLTGDSVLFKDSLYRTCLIELAGEQIATTDAGTRLRERAAPLAHQIYDKLVPPPHRFVIEKLRREERLAVTYREPDSASDDANTSGNQRRSLRVVFQKRAPRILSILEACPFLLDVLPGHMRRLQNLNLEIVRSSSELAQQDRGKPASEPLHNETALENQVIQTLWTDHAQDLGIDRTSERFGDVLITASGLRVVLQSALTAPSLRYVEKEPALDTSSSDNDRQIFLPKLILPGSDASPNEQAMVATLTLAALLATVQPTGKVHADPTGNGATELPLVLVHSRVPAVLTLTWPSPELPLHQQAMLSYYFTKWIPALKDRTEQQIVTVYVALMYSIGTLLTGRDKQEPTAPSLTLSLRDLAREVVKLSHRQGNQQSNAERSLQTWAKTGAVLLCAPEYGLSAKLANTLLAELQQALGESVWLSLRGEVTRLRRKRLRIALSIPEMEGNHEAEAEPQSPVGQAITALDRYWHDFHFGLLLEQGAAGVLGSVSPQSRPMATATTLRLLDHGTAAWLKRVREGLLQYASQDPKERKLGPLLKEAWEATWQSESYAFSNEAAQAPKFARLSTEAAIQKLPLGPLLLLGDMLAQGRTESTDLRITLAQAVPPAFQSQDGTLSPLQQGILQLLWDERALLDDDQPQTGRVSLEKPLTRPGSWPAVSVRVQTTDEDVEVPWLAVHFRTFSSMGTVMDAWNQATAVLRQPELRRADSFLLDRLALFYLRCCLAVASGSTPPSGLPDKELKSQDFQLVLNQWIHQLQDNAATPSEVPTGVFLEELWFTVIGWALPESGLSVEGVRAIIRFLIQEDQNHEWIRKTLRLREARLATLIWHRNQGSHRDWPTCRRAASRAIESITTIAKNVGHPFQVYLDTQPDLKHQLLSSE